MSVVALFHPSFGVSACTTTAAERLRGAGHEVTVVDQYDGRSFDDYEQASAFVEQIGFPELMRRALAGVADLDDGFVAAGFSNGAGMATYVATRRATSGVVLCSGTTPLSVVGAESWPDAVPLQVHAMADDPRQIEGATASVLRAVADAGGVGEFHQYPGSAHLFTDASRPDEYDEQAAELFWHHTLEFVANAGV